MISLTKKTVKHEYNLVLILYANYASTEYKGHLKHIIS